MSTVRSYRHRRALRLALALFAALALALTAQVAVAQPTPAQMKARTGWAPKDFTVLQDGDWFHAFYIETDTSNPTDTGTRLGHSRSKDLYHWEYLDSAFGPGTANFDNDRVWAPHLVKVDGVFYLFYTGISHTAPTQNHQAIGVATSANLSTWVRYSSPIVDCAVADIAQCLPNVSAGGQLRDPFALRDPNNASRWLAYYGTVADGGLYMTTGIAQTSSALTTAPWTDHVPAWVPESTWWKNQGVVESPHLFDHAGLWYLLFTSNAGTNPISVVTNAVAPVDAEASWQFRGRLHDVLGYNTNTWFASEYFKDSGGREYFGVVADDTTRRLQFRQIAWAPGDWKFSLLSPFRVSGLAWLGASGQVTEGDPANFRIDAWTAAGRTAQLEVTEYDSGQPDQVLNPATIGLPSSVALSGASTTVNWNAAWTPDDDSTPDRIEIRIRVAGEPSVRTNLLYINRRPDGDHDPFLDGARARRVGPGTTPEALAITEPALRTLRETPLGPGIGLLVDMPEEANARLEVFDAQGRRLRTLRSEVLPRGASVVLWDGRDDAGGSVRAGLYFARLQTLGRTLSSRVLVTPTVR